MKNAHPGGESTVVRPRSTRGSSGDRFKISVQYGRNSRWLNRLPLAPDRFGAAREDVCLAFDAEGGEMRPMKKPVRPQSVSSRWIMAGGAAGTRLLESELCAQPRGPRLASWDPGRVVPVACGLEGSHGAS